MVSAFAAILRGHVQKRNQSLLRFLKSVLHLICFFDGLRLIMIDFDMHSAFLVAYDACYCTKFIIKDLIDFFFKYIAFTNTFYHGKYNSILVA